MADQPAKYLSATTVCARYDNITLKTIHQWVNRGTFPSPVKINGRNFWAVAVLDEHDAGLKTEKGHGPRRRQVPAARSSEAA